MVPGINYTLDPENPNQWMKKCTSKAHLQRQQVKTQEKVPEHLTKQQNHKSAKLLETIFIFFGEWASKC